MVGDSPANDIVFGKNAGVSTALLWQRKPTVFQASERADITICHIAQLPKQLYEQYNLETAAKYPEPMAVPQPMSDAAKAAYPRAYSEANSERANSYIRHHLIITAMMMMMRIEETGSNSVCYSRT